MVTTEQARRTRVSGFRVYALSCTAGGAGGVTREVVVVVVATVGVVSPEIEEAERGNTGYNSRRLC